MIAVQDIVSTPAQDWTVPITVGIAGSIGHGKSTVARMLCEKFGYTEIAFAAHLREVCEILLGVYPEHLNDPVLKATPLVGFDNGHVFPFDARDPAALHRQLDTALAVAYFTTPDVFSNAPHTTDVEMVGANRLSANVVRRLVQLQFLRHIWMPLRNGKVFSPREIMRLIGTEIFRTVDPPIWVWAWQQRALPYAMVVTPDLRFPNEFEMLRERKALVLKVTRPGYPVDTGHVSEGQLDNHAFDVTLINDGLLEELWQALCEVLELYARKHTAEVDNGYAKLITA